MVCCSESTKVVDVTVVSELTREGPLEVSGAFANEYPVTASITRGAPGANAIATAEIRACCDLGSVRLKSVLKAQSPVVEYPEDDLMIKGFLKAVEYALQVGGK